MFLDISSNILPKLNSSKFSPKFKLTISSRLFLILDSYKLESDLLIIDSHKLINDIPLNQGKGEWENSSFHIRQINKSKYNKIVFDKFSNYMKKKIKLK